MKNLLFIALFIVFSQGCGRVESPTTVTSGVLQIQKKTDSESTFKNLALLPITTTADFLSKSAPLKDLITAEVAMQTEGFRITELKNFGREVGHRVNNLTVANKSDKAVFLMAGDVVTGGNQDRVIAEDQVIAANSIKNIEVFCVEHGRWNYFDPSATENDKKVAAFKGFYNVASGDVRKAIYQTRDQRAVWDAVEKVTAANAAKSSTQTYAALDTENEAKKERDTYLRFFDGKFDKLENVVGFVAISGDKVLGVEIFGHPNLLRQKIKSLLHAYATESIALPKTQHFDTEKALKAAAPYIDAFQNTSNKISPEIGRFTYTGLPVHIYSK